MNARRDPDQLIHHFLLEGSERLHDQVYDAVRADIEQKRQRVVIGPWRMPDMNKLVPIGVAAAAVLVALVVGTRLLGAPAPGGVGGAPSVRPSIAPSAVPSATAVASAGPSTATGDIPQGPFVLKAPAGGPAVTLTIPAPGWFSEAAYGAISKNRNSDPPNGAAILGPFFGDLYVYGDPCRWSTTTPKAPATTVAEAVTALTAQASRDASTPIDITVNGHVGKSMILHVPADSNDSTCDQGKFSSWAGGGDPLDSGPSRWHQGPGQIDELWMLDVDGQLVVVDARYATQTPAAHIAEMRAMLGSMTFKK